MILLDYIPKYTHCPLCGVELHSNTNVESYSDSSMVCLGLIYYGYQHFNYLPRESWARAIIPGFIIVVDEGESRIHISDNMNNLKAGNTGPFYFKKVLDLSSPDLLEFVQNLLVIA